MLLRTQGAEAQESEHYQMKMPDNIVPRDLNISQASACVGVSPGTFKKLVGLGLAPSPLKLPGCDRNIFDKVALDRAMDARSSGVAGA